MKNLALCKTYYYQILKPWFENRYPCLCDKVSCGVFEYDTKELLYENGLGWKSFYYLWLTKEDYDAYASEITDKIREKQLLPEAANSYIVITTVDEFVKQWFGIEKDQVQFTLPKEVWITLLEDRLLSFAQGSILEDCNGDITRIQDLLQYYPEEIRRQQLTYYWNRLNEINQVFQCHCRGNRIGEKVVLSRVMETILHLTYLYNKVYYPGHVGMFPYDVRELKVIGREMESLMIRCYNTAFIDEIMICFQSMIAILRNEDEKQQICAFVEVDYPKVEENILSFGF